LSLGKDGGGDQTTLLAPRQAKKLDPAVKLDSNPGFPAIVNSPSSHGSINPVQLQELYVQDNEISVLGKGSGGLKSLKI